MNEKSDDLDALTLQAEIALRRGDIPAVIALYERMAQNGAWRATARIGELYETGFKQGSHKLERDLTEAVRWYRKAITDSDDPLAHLGLGRIYYEGCEVLPKDFVKAHEHLNIAFQKDFFQAGIYLGSMNMFGIGMEKNLAEAEKYFLIAANGGYPIAYQYLANIAASSGHFFLTVKMLIMEFVVTTKLKIHDPNHPNLWTIPK